MGVFGGQEPLSYSLRVRPQAEHFVRRGGKASFNSQRNAVGVSFSLPLPNTNTSRVERNHRSKYASSNRCRGAQFFFSFDSRKLCQ